MPKGKKRTAADYEREIEQAAKRMEKYPEYLEAADRSNAWKQFLLDNGLNPAAVSSDKPFWEDVREKVISNHIDYYMREPEGGGFGGGLSERERLIEELSSLTISEIAMEGLKAEIYYQKRVGNLIVNTNEENNSPVVVYRNSKGQFARKPK